MASKKMIEALNKHVNLELYSAYIYAAMAAWFDGENMHGFASWMKAQAGEEVGHAAKMYKYIHDVDGRVTLEAIEKPQDRFKSPLQVFEAAYGHEKVVTKAIYALVDQAIKEGDHGTNAFLQWFVNEQIEEEATASDVVGRLKMAGDAPGALLLLDREMGGRSAGAGESEE
ncbi:MAG: bacterial non-heme ferritin [Candidatus Hydrogenedentota bacterium]